MESKNRTYFSPPVGVEQLIVFKCQDKLDFSKLSSYARKQIIKEGFGILNPNMEYSGMLKGKWFDFNPGMTGLVFREKEDVVSGKKILLQMTCHCYSEHGQHDGDIPIPDYRALYFNISVQGDASDSFVREILKFYDDNKEISKYYYNTYKITNPIERLDFTSVIFLKDETFLLDNKNTAKLCEEIMNLCNFPIEESVGESKINEFNTLAEVLSESHCILCHDDKTDTVVLHFYSCLGPKSGLRTARAIEKNFGLTPVEIGINQIIIDPVLATNSKDIKMQCKDKAYKKIAVKEVVK